jgi:hypothetical protein
VLTWLCAVLEHSRLLTDMASCANCRLGRWIVRTHGHTGFAEKRVSERTQITTFLTIEECTSKTFVPLWNIRHRQSRRLAGCPDVVTVFPALISAWITGSRPDLSWGPSSLLYNGTGSFPRVKQPGPGVDHPLPSRAEVKEKVEL